MAAINFKHLMYFRAVAHDGNLTRAAAKLNLSQSALSVQIRALEKRFGHELFERKGRALRLTEAGRIALDGADAIFAAGEEVAAALAGAGIARSELRVGALATLSRNFQLDFLRPALARGDVRITLRSGGEAELLGELAALNLDVVLLNHPPGRDVPFRLVTHRLAHQRVALVGIRKRVRGERNAAALLAREPIILPTADSGVRAAFDALADRLGVVPRIAAEVEDMAMMRLLAARRRGACRAAADRGQGRAGVRRAGGGRSPFRSGGELLRRHRAAPLSESRVARVIAGRYRGLIYGGRDPVSNFSKSDAGFGMPGKFLIVGGTGGIGAAIARRAAVQGHALHLVARDAAKLAALAGELGAGFTACDAEDADRLRDAVAAAGPSLAGLVYAVGTIRLAPLAKLSAGEIERDFRINALGAAIAVQSALPALRAAGGGRFHSAVLQHRRAARLYGTCVGGDGQGRHRRFDVVACGRACAGDPRQRDRSIADPHGVVGEAHLERTIGDGDRAAASDPAFGRA